MRALAMLGRGLTATFRRPGLVALAWLVPLLPALLLTAVARPGFEPLASSVLADRILDGRTAGVLVDLFGRPQQPLAPIGAGLPFATLLALVAHLAVAVLIARRLTGGAASARSTVWRFARAALVFAPVLALGVLVSGLVVKALGDLAASSGDGSLDLVAAGAALLVALVLLVPFRIGYDLARLASVDHDEGSMLRGVLRGVALAVRHPLLAAQIGLARVAVPLLFALPVIAVANARSLALVVAGTQMLMLVRAGWEVAVWSAELELYRALGSPRLTRRRLRRTPAPAPIPAPESPTVELEPVSAAD